MVETTMSQKKGWTRRHYTTELRNGPKHFFFFSSKTGNVKLQRSKDFQSKPQRKLSFIIKWVGGG